MSRMPFLLPLLLVACGDPAGTEVPGDIALRAFSDCGELRVYAEEALLEQMIQARYSWGGMVSPDGGVAEDAEDAGAEAPSDYTTTNTQEAGVDEIDIVKTDGQHLYVADGEEVHIVDSWPVADAERLSTLDVGGWIHGLFLHADTLLVFTTFYDQGFTERNGYGTRVLVVDVSDRAAPTVTRTLDLEGWLADGRLIEDDAWIVLNTYLQAPQEVWSLVWDSELDLPEIDWEASEEAQQAVRDQAREILRPHVHEAVADLEIEDLLPLYRDQPAGQAETGLEPLQACEQVYRPAEVSHYAMMSLVHLDLGTGEVDSTGLLSDGWQIYASKENLYVAQSSRWWWWGWGELDLDTHIHKFALGDGAPVYEAAGEVDGWILDQFSMSEHEGFLRVASTERDWWWGTGEDEGGNHVTVLEQQGTSLVEVGAVRDLAPGEQITAVRMMGEVGYVVTFEWVDPLFTIDLSDPRDPRLLGELKLPGFSTYLHPLGEDHLLAVGYAGEEDGTITGLAVNVFDVSDLAAPRLAHQLTFESDDWSWSEALWDHHAFTYHRDVLSIPLYTYDGSGSFSGMLVLDATAGGISEIGRVDHRDLVASSECAHEWGCDGYWYASMRRSVYIEDNLFSISNYGLKVNELTAPENEIARVLWHPLE